MKKIVKKSFFNSQEEFLEELPSELSGRILDRIYPEIPVAISKETHQAFLETTQEKLMKNLLEFFHKFLMVFL